MRTNVFSILIFILCVGFSNKCLAFEGSIEAKNAIVKKDKMSRQNKKLINISEESDEVLAPEYLEYAWYIPFLVLIPVSLIIIKYLSKLHKSTYQKKIKKK